MLIGNNNNNLKNFSNQNFIKNNNNQNTIKQKSTFNKELLNYSNINSKKEIKDKAYLMLQERYNQGLITLDEFTKKCNKLRQK